MKAAFLIAVLWASQACAEATYSWGGYGDDEASTLTMQESKLCYAELVIQNRVSQVSKNTAWLEANLDFGSLEVAVKMIPGGGVDTAPDTYEIETPVGWSARPDSLVLQDSEDGVVQICSDGELIS